MLNYTAEIVYDIDKLTQAPTRIDEFRDKLVVDTAEKTREQIQSNIMHRKLIKTGFLFNSVSIKKVGRYYVVFVGAWYGILHEYGAEQFSVSYPARPFFFPAVDSVIKMIETRAAPALVRELMKP
jgi:hypothetical protein